MQICKVSKTVFPTSNQQIEEQNQLQKGVHRFTFEIRFPHLCCLHRSDGETHDLKAALPPSFGSVSDSGSVSVKYVLKLQVQRPGRFRRHASMSRTVRLRQNDLATSCMATNSLVRIASPLLRLDDPISMRRKLPGSTNSRDNNGPLLLLEPILPQFGVLFAGETLPLILLVRRLSGLSDTVGPIACKSLNIRLRSITTITAQSRYTTWTSYHNLLNVRSADGQLDSAIHHGSFEIDPRVINSITVPRDMVPSFNSCLTSLNYVLEATIGLSVSGEQTLSVGHLIYLSTACESKIIPLAGTHHRKRKSIHWY